MRVYNCQRRTKFSEVENLRDEIEKKIVEGKTYNEICRGLKISDYNIRKFFQTIPDMHARLLKNSALKMERIKRCTQ